MFLFVIPIDYAWCIFVMSVSFKQMRLKKHAFCLAEYKRWMILVQHLNLDSVLYKKLIHKLQLDFLNLMFKTQTLMLLVSHNIFIWFCIFLKYWNSCIFAFLLITVKNWGFKRCFFGKWLWWSCPVTADEQLFVKMGWNLFSEMTINALTLL